MYNKKEQFKKFYDNYKMLFDNLIILEGEQKIYIGSDDKKCRFCGKSYPDVTFKNVSHAIPECMGNKQIICKEECDNCNKFFSEKLENHLDKITMCYRSINFIKGKSKIPSYKVKNDEAQRLDAQLENNKLYYKIRSKEDNGFASLDIINKTLCAELELQPHVPSMAYKALVKMALSVMPKDELENFKFSTKWLFSQENKNIVNPLIVLRTFVPGVNVFKKTLVFLLKKKSLNDRYPNCIFVIAFGNIMYQIMVPTDNECLQQKSQKRILRFISPFETGWFLGDPKVEVLDWSSSDIIKEKKEIIYFSAESIQKIDI